MDLAELMALQSGVISRAQALAAGLTSNDIRRLVRRREWAVIHPGVYVHHTGPLTWEQRSWAAVLVLAPAALSGRSALGAHDGPIHVAVDRTRTVTAPSGVVRHYLTDLAGRALWNASPPRVRVEHAVLALAAEASDDFAAIAAGSCSVLEHGYLTLVERRHGLPLAERQVSASLRGRIYRDVDYRSLGLIVELDGRLFHDSATSRDRDLDRDLDAAVDGRTTVRLGWGQVYGRPCETAPRIARLLQLRGWEGQLSPCGDCAVP